jgi:hypothetical protein
MRKVPFVKGQFYHIYNRGTDKRSIFQDKYDLQRFFQSIMLFNTIEPIGSIFENTFKKERKKTLGHPMSKLVDLACYSTSRNHFHFIMEQLVDNGIEKFMQKLGNGYTKYFNHKHKRSGVLFQGRFKSVHIHNNEYLLHLSVYVNLNNLVHKIGLGHPMSKSSWDEYTKKCKTDLCQRKNIILDQFKSKKEYEEFARGFLKGIIERKEDIKTLESCAIE